MPASFHPPLTLISNTFLCFPHRCFSFFFSEDSAALAMALARETGGEAAYISSYNSMTAVVGTQEPWQVPPLFHRHTDLQYPSSWTAHTQ